MNKKDRYHAVSKSKIRRKNVAICEKKIRYSDISQAMAGALRTIECVSGIDNMFYYKCDICNGYHLTKMKGTHTFPC